MIDQYQKICKSFNIGWWQINIRTREITVDSNLALLLKMSTFTFEQFISLVAVSERKKITSLFKILSDIEISAGHINIEVDNVHYIVELLIDNKSESTDRNLITGSARFQIDNEDVFDADKRLSPVIPYTTYVELKELELRTKMKCKTGLIFPYSLCMETNSVKITLYENGSLLNKEMSIDDFSASIYTADRERYLKELNLIATAQIPAIQLTFRSNCLSTSYKWYELIGEILPSIRAGVPDKYIGILKDIDRRQRSEESLRKTDKMFKNIYDSMPIGIELYNKEGILINSNKKALEIFGIENVAEVYGLSLFDNPMLSDNFKQKLLNGQESEMLLSYNFFEMQKFYQSSRSGKINLNTKGAALYDDENNLTHYLLVHLDETEKVNANKRAKDFENFFSAVAGFSQIGYCKWDLLAQNGFAIDQWYENMGEKPGTPIKDIVGHYTHLYPDDQKFMVDAIHKILRGEITQIQNEVRVKSTDEATLRWVYHNIVVVNSDPLNNSIELVGINVDITKYKLMEEQLTELVTDAENTLKQQDAILNNISEGLIYIDKSYTIKWKSAKKLSSLFDFSGYIPGKKCYESAFGRDKPCENCPMERMMDTGVMQSIERIAKDITVQITANPLRNNKGNLIGSILQFENITIRKQQERKINEYNHLMAAILNNIPVYLFVKDPNNDFKYLYWNRAMAEHTMIPAEKAIGHTDFEAFPNYDDAAEFRKNDLLLLEGGKTIQIQEEYCAANGEIRSGNTIEALIPSEDKLPWILGVTWDITDIKRNEKELIRAKEKAEESDRFKSSFLANMSHEIRTPLNAIVGFSELLTNSSLDEQDRLEYNAVIQKNNQLLLQLISDILDLSRMEAGILELSFEALDINSLCERIQLTSAINSEIPILFDNTLPHYCIISDENRVSQIITNFVTNAIKFTESGNIIIGYKLLDDTEIEIFVQDTGKGIPADKQHSIFERFIKLNSFAQGTGLGLSICKILSEQLHGRIGVESVEGVGSRFWITLPYTCD